MDVVIFGAGIAGLMAAICLESAGYYARIFEKTWRSHYAGMGFILVPESICALRRLGIHLEGVPLLRYYFRDEAGRILSEQPMPPGCCGIRRCDLIAALIRSLPGDETIVYDSELVDVQFNHQGEVRHAQFYSGEDMFSVQADLYVAADGIGSRGRRAIFPDWPLPQARLLEIVGLVRCPEMIRWAVNNFNKFHAVEGGIAVGVLPVDQEHVVWYLQFDKQRFSPPPEDPRARQDFVQRLVGGWVDPIPHLLARTDFSHVHLWRPVDTDLIPHFNHGKLALVGDAAHPLLPFTSQGVSSAVADAVALAEALKHESDVVQALARYSRKRRAECAPFITKGRELMSHFFKPLGTLSEIPIAK